MTRNIKGLMHALQQSINEAILDSKDVAAAMAALKRTGKCPVFTIDISMQDPPADEAEMETADEEGLETLECDMTVLLEPPPVKAVKPPRTGNDDELVLSDSDVEFLASLGVSDPSWGAATYNLPTE